MKLLPYTLLIASAAISAQAATLTVSTTNNTTANDGFCSLQEAIIAANTNAPSGDSTGECPAGEVSATDIVTLPAGIFALNDTLAITQNLVLQGVNKTDTIIDGGNSVQVLSVGTEVDAVDFELQNVRIANGGSPLAGAGMAIMPDSSVTIRDSQFSGHASDLKGGAINALEAFLTVYDSTFSNNSGTDGGAIAGIDSSVRVYRSTFSGNTATGDGGAVYSDEGYLVVNESTLTNNVATTDGGAIASDSEGTVELSGTLLSNNEAGSDGGAISMNDYELLIIEDSDLLENFAGDDGGAIYTDYSTQVTLVNTRLTSNEAAGDGGGLYLDSSSLGLFGSTVSDNSSSLDGGGLYIFEGVLNAVDSQIDNNTSTFVGGGFYLEYSGSATLTNTSVLGNTSTSRDGGGAYLYEAALTLMNASIADNSAPAGSGGGLFLDGAQLRAEHSIIRDNSALFSGGGLFAENNAMVLLNTTLSGNRVEGGDGGALYLDSGAIANLNHVTMADNFASNLGGGVFQGATDSLLAYGNSIIAGSTATEGPDCELNPGARSLGYNVIGNGTGCATHSTDQLINAPLVLTELLAPLAGNGGPTLTHALVAGSLGDNAANSDTCLPTDQRGVEREQNGKGCDIGAFERVNASASSGSTGGGNSSGGSLGLWLGLLTLMMGSVRLMRHN